jgi:nitronate monooxygenase
MNWRDTDLARSLGIRLPIVQAPMAGGWTPPRLVAQVSEAGGLGSLAGAMLTTDQLREQLRAVRSLTEKPFAVNLFAPLPAPSERGLAGWATLNGVGVPDLPRTAATFDDQLSVVIENAVPVLSFTFGIPSLNGYDGFTIGTATTVAEAVALAAAGVDAVVAQGFEAGGHRGTFLAPKTGDGISPSPIGTSPIGASLIGTSLIGTSLIGTVTLVPQVVDAVRVPVIASGGIMDGRGIAAARLLGAQGVQLGTAFLGTEEAGIGPDYRRALAAPTTVTNVLTGRYARAVRTPFVDRLEASGVQPPDYPLPRLFLTGPPLLAGQGGPLVRSMPASELVRVLEQETTDALAALG